MKLAAKQQGSLLIISLFIAIIMLGLGLALTRVIQGASHSNAVEYLGTRAFLAAQSGLEQGLNQLFPLNNSAASCTNIAATLPVTRSFSANYLAGCEVVINCTGLTGIDDVSSPSGQVDVYRISSSATCPLFECVVGQACRSEYWQTQRTLNIEAKTLN